MSEKDQDEEKGRGEIRKIEDRPEDSDIKKELSELRETLSTRGKEVDSLQSAKRHEKWYRKPTA